MVLLSVVDETGKQRPMKACIKSRPLTLSSFWVPDAGKFESWLRGLVPWTAAVVPFLSIAAFVAAIGATEVLTPIDADEDAGGANADAVAHGARVMGRGMPLLW